MGRYLDYLELDGDCYFSTKIVPNSDTEIHLDVMFTAEGYDNQDAVFVGCTTPNEQDTACYIANYGSDNNITAKYGDGDIQDETQHFTYYGTDNRWTLVLTPGVYKQLYDEFSYDVVQFTFSNLGNANADITIGGLNGDNGLERGAICRIYGVQIYQDGNLVGDFKPYEDDFEGLGFLNDVSNTFMPNQGQGTPVGPPSQSFSITPSEINIAASGGVITAYVQNLNSWTYTDVHSSISSITADYINNTLEITIGENFDTGNTIEHEIEVEDTQTGDIANILITQSAAHTPTYDKLLYIENGAAGSRSTDYLIDTNYIPTTATSVEIGLSVSNSDGASIFSTDQHTGQYFEYNGWWRFFTYQSTNMVFDCPSDSDARAEVSCDATQYNEFRMWWSNSSEANLQLISGQTSTQSTSRTPDFQTSLKLWGTNSSLYTGTKIYFIRIYEAGNLAMELVPAKIGNNVGLYETITDTLFTNDRQGVFTYEYPTPPTPPTPTSGNTFYLGDVAVSKVYIGDEEISKIYLGEELVFEAGGSPSPTGDTTITFSNISSPGTIDETCGFELDNNGGGIIRVDYSYDDINYEVNASITYYESGFTATATGGSVIVTGPFETGVTYTARQTYNNNGMACMMYDDGVATFSVTGDTMSISVPTPYGYTDEECECMNMGGTWEDGQCVFPEPDEPDPSESGSEDPIIFDSALPEW